MRHQHTAGYGDQDIGRPLRYQRREDFAIEVVGIDGDLMNSAVLGGESLA
ncbi:MAG: hypothetical protein IPF78_11465 [Flavobacteriales bacterium]|nr:hypothetical protein [Flavobacteriales bacterium]